MKTIKARFWQLIMYPENMVDNWQAIIADVVQIPFAYCIHDKDTLSGRFLGPDHEDVRKVHVHIILVYNNTTTLNCVKELCNRLSRVYCVCCPVGEPVVNVVSAYKYLIHDTESARELHKHEYDKSERIEGNNFDIGLYEVITQYEKDEAVDFLVDVILCKGFVNFNDLLCWVLETRDEDKKALYRAAIRSHSGYLERVCKGNYLKYYVLIHD